MLSCHIHGGVQIDRVEFFYYSRWWSSPELSNENINYASIGQDFDLLRMVFMWNVHRSGDRDGSHLFKIIRTAPVHSLHEIRVQENIFPIGHASFILVIIFI